MCGKAGGSRKGERNHFDPCRKYGHSHIDLRAGAARASLAQDDSDAHAVGIAEHAAGQILVCSEEKRKRVLCIRKRTGKELRTRQMTDERFAFSTLLEPSPFLSHGESPIDLYSILQCNASLYAKVKS